MKVMGMADDLTGANEVGVCFASAGFASQVCLYGADKNDLDSSPDVTVFNTETRNVSPVEAQHRVKQLDLELNQFKADVVFKKIDSTLRGNIGVEVVTLADMLAKKGVVIAPAFPAQGRTTISGHQLLYGVPVQYTTTGKDHLSPVQHSSISKLLKNQTGQEVELIHLKDVDKGPDALAERLEVGIKRTRYCVVDAAIEIHLDIIAQAILKLGMDNLCVGTTGLAKHIASRLPSKSKQKLISSFSYLTNATPQPQGGIFVIGGSLNAISLEQIRLLSFEESTCPLEVDPSQDFYKKYGPEIERLQLQLQDGKNAILHLGAYPHHTLSAIQVANDLAELVLHILDGKKVRALVLVGGQTSQHILMRLHTKALIPVGQIAEGVPVMRIVGGLCDGISVVTKGGGIGGPRALLDAVAPFQSRDAGSNSANHLSVQNQEQKKKKGA